MTRFGLLACGVLVSAACHPRQVIRVSQIVPVPLRESCVVELLNSADEVRVVGRYDNGTVYAELVIPGDIQTPHWRDGARPLFGLELESKASGEFDFVFATDWLGWKDYPEYRAFAKQTMRELQTRVVDRCTRPVNVTIEITGPLEVASEGGRAVDVDTSPTGTGRARDPSDSTLRVYDHSPEPAKTSVKVSSRIRQCVRRSPALYPARQGVSSLLCKRPSD